MLSLVSSEELAKDVTGAEALLERHQEHRMEIDARSPTFKAFEAFGTQLVQKKHYADKEVVEKMDSLDETRRQLEE